MQKHDYPLTRGDRILRRIRILLKDYTEFRHNCLPHYARAVRFLPLDRLENNHITVEFEDGSVPLHLANPIVLAAGANKNGKLVADYANIGFGGVCVGTVTRHKRTGNPHSPRVGLVESKRLIYNSMGLGNDGVEKVCTRLVEQISEIHKRGICLGLSVAETPGTVGEEERLCDFVETFEIAYRASSDFVELNVSCPNTGEARLDLDTRFVERLFAEVQKIRNAQEPKKAVFVKLSPALTDAQLIQLLGLVKFYSISGVVLGNTLPSTPALQKKYGLKVLTNDGGSGGISGRPLYSRVKKMIKIAKKEFPNLRVVACGGIDTGAKVKEVMDLGASFVECYSVVAFRHLAAVRMMQEYKRALRKPGKAL
jgi:dihydroorotate dehydrogenase